MSARSTLAVESASWRRRSGQDIFSPELRNQLTNELRPGEKLAWSGQPRPGAVWVQSLFAFIFGGIFTAFAIFWMVGPYLLIKHGDGPPFFFTLFGVPFVLVGLGIMSTPFWSRKSAARTVYAVTDQRAIILKPRMFGGWTVQTFMPDRLTAMTRSEKDDGSGDLIFEQFTERAGSGSRTVRRGFVGVERVRDVEDLIVKNLVNDRRR